MKQPQIRGKEARRKAHGGKRRKTVLVAKKVEVVPLPFNYTIYDNRVIYDVNTGRRVGCVMFCDYHSGGCSCYNAGTDTFVSNDCLYVENMIALPIEQHRQRAIPLTCRLERIQ